ncbi:hypothetical protein JRQ81_011610 [Phrynocephalus forsythii]|uniref:Phospholipase A2 inhibitor and Ly6/PLAUR domain-containing protein-like n=1 Tax=Phrynocephalus forsythii TaxID=171643 RepID=A0A9Q0X862_9SAUR|nr:hypothetical protein JRQ81_011610 [Phrynocephalus forsythii]
MQTLLRLFLSFVLPMTGTSLQCEVCYSIDSNCNGTMQTCPFEKDTCAIVFSESTLDGLRIFTTEKGCKESVICTSFLADLYLGQEKFYRAHLYCCTGHTCGKILPDCNYVQFLCTFPPQLTPNGLQCPACYSWSETCSSQMVNCTGLDTFCFSVLSRTYTESLDGLHVDNIMKGCTTNAVCESFQRGISPFFGSTDNVIHAECSPDIVSVPLSRRIGFIVERVSNGFPIIMKALLGLLIAFMFFTKGTSLVCEVCHSNTMTCAAKRSRCHSIKDECFVKFSKYNLEGITEQILVKGCERSPFCPYDQIHLDLGKGRYYKSGLFCCNNRLCQNNVPSLPSTNRTINGKQCHACFAWSQTCKPELLACTGSNTNCFNMTSIIYERDQIMMGCASPSACKLFQSRTTSTMLEGVISAECEPTDSRGTRSANFSLLSFSGILLLKLFS